MNVIQYTIYIFNCLSSLFLSIFAVIFKNLFIFSMYFVVCLKKQVNQTLHHYLTVFALYIHCE